MGTLMIVISASYSLMIVISAIPTRQVLDGFQKYLHPCALEKVASALEGLRQAITFFH